MSYEKVLWDFYARRGICTHVDHKKNYSGTWKKWLEIQFGCFCSIYWCIRESCDDKMASGFAFDLNANKRPSFGMWCRPASSIAAHTNAGIWAHENCSPNHNSFIQHPANSTFITMADCLISNYQFNKLYAINALALKFSNTNPKVICLFMVCVYMIWVHVLQHFMAIVFQLAQRHTQ